MTALRNDSAASMQPHFIDILLDETGSMQRPAEATRQGFNAFVAEQREQPGACYLTLSKFDASETITPYRNLSIGSVPDLSFFPRGGTNLYDVMGDHLTTILASPRPGRTMVVLITDGEDTSSRRFRADQVSALVAQALNSGIQFLYFGAGRRASSEAEAMGFPSDTIKVFEIDNMRETMADMSVATSAFRAA